MKTTLWIAIGIIILLQAVVRLTPTDPERWDIDPFTGRDPGAKGVKRVLLVATDAEDALARIATIAETEPRTRRVAGSLDEGRLTYRTRSAFWGFPDFTTISARPDESGASLALLARARFGKSDMGVNARRVKAWVKAAGF